MKSHYEVLGISPRASLDTIKRAFRQAAKENHPDLVGDGDAAAEQKLKMIIVAYKVLRDPDLRAEYDAFLAHERETARRERWDAILQFTAATAVLSAVLIGLEILFVPSLGDFLSRPQPTRSVTLDQPPQPKAEPQREAGSPPASPPAVRDELSAAPSAQPEAVAAASPPPADVEVAEPVAPATPMSASELLERALARSRQGDLELAVADFDEVVRLVPRNTDVYRYRAEALVRMGRIDRGLDDYDRAIRLDPKNPLLLRDRALALQKRGDLDEALVDLDRAVRMSFSDAELYSDRGAVWLAKGRYDRALADFNQALKLNPDLPLAAMRRKEAIARKREHRHADDDRPSPAAAEAETTGTLPPDSASKAAPR
ncbi:tetratricopeptide repeat protein [Bradyrhizobium sp. HKCCYLR20261]|uniref:J domain-containing protein n=1 Tax=unclassified Bradyrhizobium TaxID=2631580 RepID=UPI003EBC6423